MATNTYVALDKVTVSGTSTSTISFTGISQAYTDLVVVFNGTTDTDTGIAIRVGNGSVDTGSNYSFTYLVGNGSSATSGRGSNQTFAIGGDIATTNSTAIMQFMNYSNATTNKTILARGAAAALNTVAEVSLWRSTAAINRIEFFLASPRVFGNGSTFSLYGIAATGAGAKATGGTVFSDDQYYYHAFTTSGTFTPTQSLSCDYLVVAGGGGGGGALGGGYLGGGGGGAGGYLTSIGGSPLSLSATGYTVTIGAGGSGGTGNRGSQGSNSVFSSITSTGGGYGGSMDATPIGGNGGSGGGGSEYIGTAAGGTGISGQGFAGGLSKAQPGGGGGAGAVGGMGDNSVVPILKGIGGIGSNSAATWATATFTGITGYYAGGGGGGGYGGAGGVGGTGGGANGGANLVNGDSGVVNTGGGGGGSGGSAGSNLTGGSGGSGLVIVRYAK